jgi:hypothetical protein
MQRGSIHLLVVLLFLLQCNKEVYASSFCYCSMQQVHLVVLSLFVLIVLLFLLSTQQGGHGLACSFVNYSSFGFFFEYNSFIAPKSSSRTCCCGLPRCYGWLQQLSPASLSLLAAAGIIVVSNSNSALNGINSDKTASSALEIMYICPPQLSTTTGIMPENKSRGRQGEGEWVVHPLIPPEGKYFH